MIPFLEICKAETPPVNKALTISITVTGDPHREGWAGLGGTAGFRRNMGSCAKRDHIWKTSNYY